MKGVIVQIGEPKSIVLFNNGKIRAITTPADCHVGMVVTVKFNDRLKIIVIPLAAVFLLTAGILIGAAFRQNRNFPADVAAVSPSATAAPPGTAAAAFPETVEYRDERGRQIHAVTVEQAKHLSDDTPVLLVGNIVGSEGQSKYTFRDSTGDITVEISRRVCHVAALNKSDIVEITGEVDIERGKAVIEAKSVRVR